MTTAARLSGTAALIGDPARANILMALLDGRALTVNVARPREERPGGGGGGRRDYGGGGGRGGRY